MREARGFKTKEQLVCLTISCWVTLIFICLMEWEKMSSDYGLFQQTLCTVYSQTPLIVGDFKNSSGLQFVTMVFQSLFPFFSQCPLASGERWYLKWSVQLRVFQGFFSPVAHFSVMGNKMWFQACWRTWMIPIQNLDPWVSQLLFLFSLIWIIDGLSEKSFHLPLNLIYHWQSIVSKW